MTRTLTCALALLIAVGTVHAQDVDGEPEAAAPNEATADDAADDDPAAEGAAEETTADDADAEEAADDEAGEVTRREPPKVAVVVAGDPDPERRAAARRVERAVEERLRMPFDPGLRAALRGEPGQSDDGLEGVRRERRRLGLGEQRDAPVLATLGQRAGATAVAVVRTGEGGAELVVLDVRNAAFYEGALALTEDVDDEHIARFVARRAEVSARGAEIAAPVSVVPEPPAATEAPAAATEETPAQPAEQPGFFEEFWPYLVAGVLLAGMITAIALTSTTAGSTQPVLRFVPGGR